MTLISTKRLNSSLLTDAKEYLLNYYRANELNGFAERWSGVESEIFETGTYWQTEEELAFGAKVAWRNSNRCIGRLFWKTLKVLDFRKVQTEKDFVESIEKHFQTAQATNKIRSVISIFPPNDPHNKSPFQILNYTLIQYAGYPKENGTVIGDPAHVNFTKLCLELGWKGKRTPFDILPIVWQDQSGAYSFYQLPSNLIKEVHFEHPEFPWWSELNLKWYSLPIISNMRLEIGGVVYPTAPFNGWYMLNEIATRNLGDQNRYDLLPLIGDKMGLDKSISLWKDKALLAINEAVYYSFNKAGVTIVDHHTASEQFMKFVSKEEDAGREVTGEWSWLIPPNAGSTMEVFHQDWKNEIKKPNFFYNTITY